METVAKMTYLQGHTGRESIKYTEHFSLDVCSARQWQGGWPEKASSDTNHKSPGSNLCP